MSPRLLLLTGPAVGEVAGVLRTDHTCIKFSFEVRDYLTAPCEIWKRLRQPLGYGPIKLKDTIEGVVPLEVRDAICALPGGEEWLVGLVLPEAPEWARGDRSRDAVYSSNHVAAHELLQAGYQMDKPLPARLAILAAGIEEEVEFEVIDDQGNTKKRRRPHLLVERVRAWGGEMWNCFSHATGPNAGLCGIDRGLGEGTVPVYTTWAQAVAAALGEGTVS